MRFLVLVLTAWLMLAAEAIQVAVLQGDGAIHNIEGKTFVEPVVSVTTPGGAPIAGASVTFLMPEIGPSGILPGGSMLTASTNAEGLATARGFRSNRLAGQWEIRVTVSHQGQHASLRIPQTNAAPLERVERARPKRHWIWAAVASSAALGAAVAFGGADHAASPVPAPPPMSVPSPTPTVITTGANSIVRP
jgi:hypothetical protein